jgi:hypothetical protein
VSRQAGGLEYRIARLRDFRLFSKEFLTDLPARLVGPGRLRFILDAVAQFFIFRQVHPDAVLLVGPVLIGAPYAIARAVTTRVTQIQDRA